MSILYTTTVHATGEGRNGHVQSDCGTLDTDVGVPKELGGAGGATNPEMLFAAGYAACFHNALRLVAGAEGVDTTDSEVSATVGIGPIGNGAFGLEVELDVSLPAVDRATAEAVVAKAHHVCPYSNATRGNIEVKLNVV
jgi:Ohr subfamily peroxiredoxin